MPFRVVESRWKLLEPLKVVKSRWELFIQTFNSLICINKIMAFSDSASRLIKGIIIFINNIIIVIIIMKMVGLLRQKLCGKDNVCHYKLKRFVIIIDIIMNIIIFIINDINIIVIIIIITRSYIMLDQNFKMC